MTLRDKKPTLGLLPPPASLNMFGSKVARLWVMGNFETIELNDHQIIL